MKKITIIFLLALSFGYAQQQEYLLDFEEGTPSGDVSNWLTFEGDIAPAEIIDNPDTDGGTVPVTKVLRVVAPAGGNFFDGVNNSFDGEAFGTWKLDASVPNNATFTMDINKNYVGTVGIKMGTNTGGTAFEITNQNVDNDIVDEWQTLTWTIDVAGIPPTLETDLSQVVIFIDWTQGQPNREEPAVLHVNNIRFNAEKLTEPSGGGGAPASPLTAAPDPTEAEANVLSLFSNSYTDSSVDTWRTSWSQGQLEDLQIEGNDTKRYFDLDFVGIEFFETPVNASDSDFFHLDVWSNNADLLRIKLVNFNGTNFDNEGELAFEINQNEWVSLKIPLEDFADPNLVTDPNNLLTNRNSLSQLIFSGTPTGLLEVYVDNIYFSADNLSNTSFDSSKLSIYPNPASSFFTIDSDLIFENLKVFNLLGQVLIDLNSPSKTIDVSSLKTGVYLVQLSSGQQNLTKRLIIK